eukprot:gb/GECH01007114.1/.p1 GENE.gb/GECH01007114.1/~~gb/GECH01007114.1/.p1  ORF type:complete len:710 (+),score=185.81 gb/GECH01007114.1/:1-2130(+)
MELFTDEKTISPSNSCNDSLSTLDREKKALETQIEFLESDRNHLRTELKQSKDQIESLRDQLEEERVEWRQKWIDEALDRNSIAQTFQEKLKKLQSANEKLKLHVEDIASEKHSALFQVRYNTEDLLKSLKNHLESVVYNSGTKNTDSPKNETTIKNTIHKLEKLQNSIQDEFHKIQQFNQKAQILANKGESNIKEIHTENVTSEMKDHSFKEKIKQLMNESAKFQKDAESEVISRVEHIPGAINTIKEMRSKHQQFKMDMGGKLELLAKNTSNERENEIKDRSSEMLDRIDLIYSTELTGVLLGKRLSKEKMVASMKDSMKRLKTVYKQEMDQFKHWYPDTFTDEELIDELFNEKTFKENISQESLSIINQTNINEMNIEAENGSEKQEEGAYNYHDNESEQTDQVQELNHDKKIENIEEKKLNDSDLDSRKDRFHELLLKKLHHTVENLEKIGTTNGSDDDDKEPGSSSVFNEIQPNSRFSLQLVEIVKQLKKAVRNVIVRVENMQSKLLNMKTKNADLIKTINNIMENISLNDKKVVTENTSLHPNNHSNPSKRKEHEKQEECKKESNEYVRVKESVWKEIINKLSKLTRMLSDRSINKYHHLYFKNPRQVTDHIDNVINHLGKKKKSTNCLLEMKALLAVSSTREVVPECRNIVNLLRKYVEAFSKFRRLWRKSTKAGDKIFDEVLSPLYQNSLPPSIRINCDNL